MEEKDVMEYANKALEAFKGDAGLLNGFSLNPADIIKKIIGIELPDDIINKIIEAVKGLLAGGALDAAKDALGSVTGAASDALNEVTDAADGIAGAASGTVGSIMDAAAGAADTVADKAEEAAEEGGGILSSAINAIKKLF